MRKILAFAVIVEIGTGVLLLLDPALVLALLVGADLAGEGAVPARGFGIALVALGLACWPSGQAAGSGGPAVRGMLVYNAAIALYLTYLGSLAHLRGLLLWPGVALHAAVALLMVVAWRNQ